jgi:hypothetical protein
MKLRMSWTALVHEVAPGMAVMLVLVAAGAAVSAWLLWQQAGHTQRHGATLRERAQSLANTQAPPPLQPQAPSPAELHALHERLQLMRREHAARAWTANDWLDLLARDMPASVQLSAFQHGPERASVSFTAEADDPAALAGWLLHMEAHGNLAEVSVLRQDSRQRGGATVVRMDVRIRR